jgi:hypothetical protein
MHRECGAANFIGDRFHFTFGEKALTTGGFMRCEESRRCDAKSARRRAYGLDVASTRSFDGAMQRIALRRVEVARNTDFRRVMQ